MNGYLSLSSGRSSTVNKESNTSNNRTNIKLKRRLNKSENSIYYNNTLYAEHYTTMDLCSQAQMSEGADNILNRMDKLRVFARVQQIKSAKSQRQQISFIF